MITRFVGLPALLASLTLIPSSVFAIDDGTYSVIDVMSNAKCTQLCAEDEQCRGSMTIQPDTRYPNRQCLLNNGLGQDSPFKQEPPDPINMSAALEQLNDYRAEYKLPALTMNPMLVAAAKAHSDDLAAHGMAAHEGSDGSLHDTRITRQGYQWRFAAENVATGQKSWDAAFKAWQLSPGHNRNLLTENATELGIALTHEPTTRYVNYWTMVLATPQ